MDRSDRARTRKTRWMSLLLAASIVLTSAATAGAAVPIRLSVKFMRDLNGNFPVMGAITNEADLDAQVEEANRIYRLAGSEFQLDVVEVVDLDEQAMFIRRQLIDDDGDPSTPMVPEPLRNLRDRIRNAAQNDTARFAWQDDAVNVYIVQDGSGVADFPPNNDIFLVGQGARFTTTGHEVGHIVDLLHTHEDATSSNDRCSDTVEDDDSWNIDGIAMNAFGANYVDLNDPAEEKAVDDVWFNLMSYHPTRDRLTGCQLDRGSDGAYRTRDQILDASVRYVDARNTSSPYSGTWKDPYRSLDQLDQSGTGDGAYWVLLSGTHTFTGTLDTPVAEIVTRRGASTIREDAPRWRDEPDLSRSTDPAIVAGIAAVRAADRAGDREGAISALRALAAATAGDERTVVELEIAQRLGQLGRGDDAIALYRSIGDRTDDPYLRAETASQIGFIARWRAHEGRRKGQPDAAPKQAPDRLDDPGARDSGLDGAAMPARPAERAEGRLPTREIRPTTRRAEGPKASPRERVAASRLRGPVEGTGWPAVGETSVTRPSPGEAEHTPETGGSSRSMRALSGFALVAACTLVHRAWRRRRG